MSTTADIVTDYSDDVTAAGGVWSLACYRRQWNKPASDQHESITFGPIQDPGRSRGPIVVKKCLCLLCHFKSYYGWVFKFDLAGFLKFVQYNLCNFRLSQIHILCVGRSR